MPPHRRPAGPALSDTEQLLAERLVELVDLTGRILLTGLQQDQNLFYIGDKARQLAFLADRLAGDATRAYRAAELPPTSRNAIPPVRMRLLAAHVARLSRIHPAGPLLFPKAAGR
jgi:hypothetical protein